MPSSFDALLNQAVEENNLDLIKDKRTKLINYLKLIQKWNKVFNLTSITQPRDMVYLHIIDSLLIHSYLSGERFLDVGTGAGLPGIPLAILNPNQQWVLLDKNSKKTRFLTQVIATLSLHNIFVVQSRSENFHPTQCFDSILSRAFGNLTLFAETTEHLLSTNGQWIAMKGKYPKEELAELPERFKVLDVSPLRLIGMDIERHIVRIIKK